MTLIDERGVRGADPADGGCDLARGSGEVSSALIVDAMNAVGDVPIEAARVIARALNPRTRRLFDVFTQAMFVDAATHKPLDQLAADVEHWLDVVDPDGPAPEDATTDSLHASSVPTTTAEDPTTDERGLGRDWACPAGLASVVGSPGCIAAPAT